MKNVWVYQGPLGDGPEIFSNPKNAFNFFKSRAEFTGKRKIKYNRKQGKQTIITYSSYLRDIKINDMVGYEDIYGDVHCVVKKPVNPIFYTPSKTNQQ